MADADVMYLSKSECAALVVHSDGGVLNGVGIPYTRVYISAICEDSQKHGVERTPL